MTKLNNPINKATSWLILFTLLPFGVWIHIQQEQAADLRQQHRELDVRLISREKSSDHLVDTRSSNRLSDDGPHDDTVQTQPDSSPREEFSAQTDQVDLMELPLRERLKEEYAIVVDVYYEGFLREIGVDEVAIENITVELLNEYQRYQENYFSQQQVEINTEFVSAQPGEGVVYLPGRVMKQYLSEDELLSFSSYQFGLAKSQHDVFEYFESQIKVLASDTDFEDAPI